VRTYIAWTTVNLRAAGPRVLSVAPSWEEAADDGHMATCPNRVLSTTEYMEQVNLRVQSLTTFRKAVGRVRADRAIDAFEAGTNEEEDVS
jgi:hypothetical protein